MLSLTKPPGTTEKHIKIKLLYKYDLILCYYYVQYSITNLLRMLFFVYSICPYNLSMAMLLMYSTYRISCSKQERDRPEPDNQYKTTLTCLQKK